MTTSKDSVISVGECSVCHEGHSLINGICRKCLMAITEIVTTLQSVTDALAEYVAMVGECDHSVNICNCGDRDILANARQVLARVSK